MIVKFKEGNVTFTRHFKYLGIYGPVVSKHGNQRSLLYAGSMEYLGRTTGQQRHGVGRGGGWERGTGETGNSNGTAVGESEEGKGARGGGREKKDRWWGPLRRNRGSTKEEVPIKFGTYNIRNGRKGGLGNLWSRG